MMVLNSKSALFLKGKIFHRWVFTGSIIFFFFALVFSFLHYMNIYYGNNVMWISWILAVLSLLYSFLPRVSINVNFRTLIRRPGIYIVLFIIVLYWSSHLWNFPSAPWNQNGLFDDAAWDIYYAKNHIFNGTIFQAAFFDDVSYISREVVFHYYISIFFKLLGYNLLVFNISLLFLGFITVFFTSFLIYRLFNNSLVTYLSVVIINFFPLQYMQIFMGHRYAIAAPLMVVSLYFLYTSFINKSFFRVALSAFFAALCWDSAIMGKQYIGGLILAGICILIFGKKQWKSKENFALVLVWILSLIISATPLLVYILFNYNLYTLHERSLFQSFYSQYQIGGLPGIKPYIDQLRELFFAKFTYERLFLPDFQIIPFAYYVPLVAGLIFAFLKKRFELIFLSFIPIVAAFISGSYDFRVLLAVPIWVVCIALAFYILNTYVKLHVRSVTSKILIIFGFGIVLLGLLPSISYVWKASKDPNYLYFLPHKDVAVSRLAQDIVVGNLHPTSRMKSDELNRKVDFAFVTYDTLVCPYSAFAIIHVYLQNYNDKKILSFCNQGPQFLQTSDEILNENIRVILDYQPKGKDLKLVWEVSDKSAKSISVFNEYKKYGSEQMISDTIEGRSFSLYILTIKKENIEKLQQEIGIKMMAFTR